MGDWRVRVGAGVLALLAVVLLAQAIHDRSLYSRLLRTDGDLAVQNPKLVAFATDKGKAAFAAHCASCHGAEMKGDRTRGIADLSDSDWLYGSGRVAEIEQTILYGIRSGHPRAWNLATMPGFALPVPSTTYKTPPLTPSQIHDIVEYVRLIGDKPADAAAAARGVKLYSNAGQCFDCHANDGEGDAAIGAPDLVDDVWLYGDGSPQSLFNSIAHGHQGICPSWTHRLPAGQIRALAVYLHTHAAKAPPLAPIKAAAALKQENRS